jgi:hypothetical protein
MTILRRENVIKNDRLNLVSVNVSEWGEVNSETGECEEATVFVREITAAELDRYQSGLVRHRGKKTEVDMTNARAKLVVLCACDENRQRIFNDSDVEWLTKKSARVINRIYDAAVKLNNIIQSDEDEEELEKN